MTAEGSRISWLPYDLFRQNLCGNWTGNRDQDQDQNGSLYIMSNLHTATYVGTWMGPILLHCISPGPGPGPIPT